MKTKYNLLFLLLFIFFSCSEKEIGPISVSKGKPGVVTEIKTKPIGGGVIISYRIPNDEDILEVKAVYTLENGKTFEKTCSYYDNKLEIQGHIDTQEHEVTIYTINRAREMSDPVIVKYIPLESPFVKINNSVNIENDFGGANFSWLNEDEYPVDVEFFTPDSLDNMQLMRVLTTKSIEVNYSLRGYDAVERKFGILFRDNYGNITDTITSMIVPYFEKKLDKSKMNMVKLENDADWIKHEGQERGMIDDNRETIGHTDFNTLPAALTVDLGQNVNLSRIVFFNRIFIDSYYSWGNPKRFKVYGRLEAPSQDGNWAEWGEPLIEDIIERPSGEATDTEEDVAKGEEGFDFNFPISAGPLRYIRVVVISTQADMTLAHIAELDFYGDDAK